MADAHGVLALLFAAACGAHEAPVVTPATARATPDPWATSPAAQHFTPAPSPPATPPDLVPRFEAALRAGADLPTRVRGPIVVLDFDRQTITVLCGEPAQEAARVWDADLVDPNRVAAKCGAAPGVKEISCVQVQPDVRGLVFEDGGRLLGAFVGSRPRPFTGLNAKQFRARIATATCP